MRIPMISAVLAAVVTLALPAAALAQDQQVGQAGSVWNLGELAPGAYPSTVTAVNKSCPGAHDFHISLEGETVDFLVITGPSILTDISPGGSKTSDVYFDLRDVAPGPHNDGTIVVKCVDCPPICTQDYDVLAVRLTVTGDASAPSGTAADTSDSPWAALDLTSLDPSVATPGGADGGDDASARLRWINDDSIPATTLVQDAVANGLADVSFEGTGRAAGDVFRATITRHAPTPFEMTFPLGSVIQPDDPGYSPIMVADNGAVALLEEVTVVVVVGFTLDPRLQPPPAIDGSGPAWSVGAPPSSGPFAGAVNLINAGFSAAGQFNSPMDPQVYLRVVVQRAIWFSADPDNFGKQRLVQDVTVQVEVTRGSQSSDEVDAFTEQAWTDINAVINMGKSREPPPMLVSLS